MSRRRYNDFLHGNSSGSTTTCKRLALRRRLLRLEPLEPRRLLATVNWDGNTDGDGDGVTWTDRFNWTSDALPGAADDAVIGATFAADTITHASGTTTIRSLTSEATVAVTGGTFTITDNSTINNALDVSGTASLTLSSLTLGGTGTVTNDATVNLAVSTVNTALNNQGTLLVLPGVAGSTINGALSTEDMSTVRVEGNASVGPATLTVANGFTNNGTIELTSINGALHGATLNVSSGTLINVGEIESAPGTGGARRLNAQLDNRGTLAVLQSLDMNNNTGRTFTSTDGAIEVDTGKTLTIINGTTVLGSNSVLTGSGGINLDGTHTLELTTDLTLTTTKPTLAFPGAVTVNGPGDLINQASLTIHNDTINADLNNQGTLLVLPRGDSRISGLLTTGDMSTIRLEGNHDDARASLTVDNGFTNNGLIELTSINGDRHGATLNVTNGTLINAAGGEIRSSLGTGGARTLNAQLENQGTLTVSQSLGITNTSRTLTSTDGTIQVDTGKTLTITNGTTVLGSSTLLSGDGQISLAGTQTLELASDLTLTSTTFVFPGAVTVNGPGDLINQASLSLSGDTINADLNNQGTLLVETRGDSTINGALTTNGTSIIRVVGNASEGSVNFTVEDGFINNGLIELTSINGALHGATLNVTNGTLINAADGEIRSSVGTGGTRTLNAQLDNRGSLVVAQSLTLSEGSSAHTNSGAVDVQAGTLAFVSSSTYTQTAGTTAVADGATLSSTLPIQLQGGVLEGGGTVDSNVSNVGGTVSPGVSPGRLTIDGDYTQESGGTLLIEVGGRTPATGFDQLVVSGAATLAGRLQVDLINGFTPEIDDSFLVLDGETTGTFSTLDLDRLPPGRKWEVAINSVTLNVVEDPTDLVLTKTDSVESVNAGQDLTYTITVTNAGMVEGVNALLSDVLPSGTTFQSFTVPAGWTPSTPAVGSGGTVTATTPSLAGGDTATFTLVVKVDRGLADGTTLSNTATVTSQTPEFNDDNNSATVETFVTVPPNEPPVLDPIGNRSGSEGTAITFTATASDPNQDDELTFSLDAGVPAGATINSATGAFSWTPSEAQGPGTFSITVRVTDDGDPALSDSETITITVSEVNQPPVLNPIGNRSGDEGTAITFTATASDPDSPANALVFSLDTGAPTGATIDAATGAFSWTPSEAQGPGTFSITVRVTDDGDPALSDSETIAIAVSEVNQPPVLNPIGNRSGDEGTAITFTATASDLDSPANAIAFSLDTGAPTGATIDAATGAFSWTPSEAQGPGTFSITVRVTDDGDPALSDSETITITVNEVNLPPVLDPIADRNAAVGQTVMFTATATDPDFPANALTFSLDAGAPTGAAINSSTGEFSFTPSAAQAGQTFEISVRVTDDGQPILSDAETFNVTVAQDNRPPLLNAIGNRSGAEGTPITFTATASDTDGDNLAFSLDTGAPTGATIDAATGAFSWTPSEAQGPGTFSITVRVTDDGGPALSDSETITITVNEVNLPPVLDPIADRNAAVGQTVMFTATATDPDFPANALTFSLDAGAPTGAAINSSTGEFSFTPSAAQAGQTFEISVRVTDNGNPELVDSETITITVDEVNFPPVLNPIADRNANVGQTLTFTATASDPDLPANNLTFSLGAGAPAGATINPGTGVFSWTPSAAQGGQTFEITVRATDDREPALSDTETFEVTVQPLVEPQFTMSAINGPNVAVPGQLRSYFVTFSDTGAGETYTATIDWGDGTVDNGFVAATSSGGNTTGTVSFWHTYTTIGDRTVQLTLRDGDGNEQTAQTDVTVQLITFQPDPLDDVRRSLVVGGFEAVNDQITFVPAAGGVNVLYNGYDHGRFAFDGSVVAFGQSGDDTIVVNPSFTRSAMLFGQAGNDQLIGGGGSNVLVGGTGADMLFGSAARDLLFGGLGADHLQGHGPDGLGSADDGDLLASDFTVHEFDTERLASLFHRWTSSDTYAERLHNLRFEEHPALNNTTVFDDFEVDQLTGGQGQDWFLFLASDLVADPEAGEEGLGVPFN